MLKKNIPLLFIIIISLALCSLGIWQVQRLQEKNEFLTKVKQNLVNSPVILEEVEKNPYYAKINLNGHFLEDKNIYLYGRVRNIERKEAYYLITPFKTNNEKIILVARGWFFKENLNKVSQIINNKDEQITAIVLKSEKKQLFIPENDFNNNIWFTLNVEDAEKCFTQKLENFYLIQISTNSIQNDLKEFLYPINPDKLLNIRNDHLEYAITWFGLAISVLIMFYIKSRSDKLKH